MSDPKAVVSQLLSPVQADTLAATATAAWETIASTLQGLLGALPAISEVEGRLVMPDELLAAFGEPHLVLPLELTTARDQSATAYAIAPTATAALFFQSVAEDPVDQEQQTMVVAGTTLGQVVQALNIQQFSAFPSGLVVAADDMAANAMPELLPAMDEPALVITATLQAARPLPFTLLLPGTFLDILAQAIPAGAVQPSGAPTASEAATPASAFAGSDSELGFTLSAEDIENAQLIDEAPAPQPAPAFASAGQPSPAQREPTPIAAAKARFAPLTEPERSSGRSSIDLLADLRMNVTVELGRTQLTVADVLGLGPGSVVELERLAGEPVDILVNDRLIARGEVVVVDENFGVRVVEVVRRGQEPAEPEE